MMPAVMGILPERGKFLIVDVQVGQIAPRGERASSFRFDVIIDETPLAS